MCFITCARLQQCARISFSSHLFLYSVTCQSNVWGSPYGPTASPYLCLCVCVCVHWGGCCTCVTITLSLFSLSLPICGFALGPMADVWVSSTARHSHLAYPAPIPDPSSTHAASLNSTDLSGSLFHSPSQHWPRASWDQHRHPPPLTAALCQAAGLASAGWGLARQLDNNFSQWNRVRSSLGTLTRLESSGPVVWLVCVLC